MLRLEKNGIETSNIQPSVKKYGLIKNIKFKNADYINNHGFFMDYHLIKLTIKKNLKKCLKNLFA